MTDRQRNVFILALVAGLIAASAIAISIQKTFLGLDLKGGVQLIYQGEPSSQTPHVTQAALQRAVDVMNQRVNQLGVSEPQISTAGGNQISVSPPAVQNTHRAEALVGTTAQLEFYDWEANALTPTGQTVASQLLTQNANAVSISQGSGTAAGPGSPGAGSMALYTAVQLAAKQPEQVSVTNARRGPEYYMFGAPGSAACASAARYYRTTPIAGQRCYLQGPADNVADLTASLPTGVSASQGQMLVVQRGTTVLQAGPANFSNPPKLSDPAAQFFVLKDHVSLFGNDITNPQQSTDQAGAPDVAFGFTSRGGNEFQTVTAQIANRG